MRRFITILAGSMLLAGCFGSSGDVAVEDTLEGVARAFQSTTENHLIGGSPVARAQVGDYVIENENLRVIVQQPGRRWYGGINPYGGSIIDADIQRPAGEQGRSHFEATALAVNITTIPNFQSIQILNDGSDGEAAVIRATGPVDLFEYVNPASQVATVGLEVPPTINDDPLPIEVQTDYILEPGEEYVIERTTLFNQSGDELEIFLGEYLNGSGEVDAFMPPMGLGEPMVTLPCGVDMAVCDAGECDPCNMMAYTGYGSALGVSYGRVHNFDKSSSFSQAGVNAWLYGVNVLGVFLGLEGPNFTVPGNGELQLEDRYFVVTPGSVSDVQKVRNRILGYETGRITGTVSGPGGAPVEGALVALTRPGEPGPDVGGNEPPAPEYDVLGQDRTNASGQYDFEVPPGEYDIRVFKPGRGTAPEVASVSFAAGELRQQDFELQLPGHLAVNVVDDQGQPVPAKVQLVGIDDTKPEPNLLDLAGIIMVRGGIFFDQFTRDPLPFGIAFVDFADANGQLPARAVVPGEYELVVSRGHRYSAHRELVTINPDETTQVTATIDQVMATPGFISADFHVHAIDSLDSRIPRADRLATFLAEGLDFFTPSDHGMQVNYLPEIAAAGVGHLIGTATSAELTTPDYGHFNAWPRFMNPDIPSGGSADWGWRDVPPGERFPALGNYLMTVEDLINEAKDDPAYSPVVQINHINSFFSGVGLGVDTAEMPPQSTVDPIDRRLDPARANHFADNFDALEIWIGVNSRGGLGETMDENMADWFNMINQGIVKTAVASSDTHVARLTSMATRSMVASSVEDPGQLTDHAQALADKVREGRVFVTNAPFIDVTVETTAGVAGLSLDHPLEVATGLDGTAQVHVNVTSPDWAEFARINFYINNAPEEKSSDPPRYTICPDEVLVAGDDFTVEEADGVLTASATLDLGLLVQDTWVVVKVEGIEGESEPMFPVEPNSLSSNGNETLADLTGSNVGQGGIMATAISNPLFIDVTGDGWSPPGVLLGSCD